MGKRMTGQMSIFEDIKQQNMCDFNTLSSNDNGFILRCNRCGFYQLGFAGALLSLNPTDYQKFGELIEHLAQKEISVNKRSTRHIVIPTPYYGVNLMLSKNEIDELYQLVLAAENEKDSWSTGHLTLPVFSEN